MNTLFNKVFGGCNMKILNDPGTMRWYKKLCSLAKKGNKSAIKYKKLWLREGIKNKMPLSRFAYKAKNIPSGKSIILERTK
jgi:hypothetical protein